VGKSKRRGERKSCSEKSAWLSENSINQTYNKSMMKK
jgi:hypothetical protein